MPPPPKCRHSHDDILGYLSRAFTSSRQCRGFPLYSLGDCSCRRGQVLLLSLSSRSMHDNIVRWQQQRRRRLRSRLYLLNLEWLIWFVPDPHPPTAIPAIPVLLLLTIHEEVQMNEVHWTGVIPAVEWWVCLRFVLEVTSRIFHGSILIMVPVVRSQMLPQILDSIRVGVSEPLHRDSIGKEAVHDVCLPEIGRQCL